MEWLLDGHKAPLELLISAMLALALAIAYVFTLFILTSFVSADSVSLASPLPLVISTWAVNGYPQGAQKGMR